MVRLETQAVLLSVRPFQEYDALVSFLTAERGLMRALVKGGQSRKQHSQLQPGASFDLVWSARVEDQLGYAQLSLDTHWPGRVLESGLRLAALAATCELLDSVLAEREAQPALYEGLGAWLETLMGPAWGEALVVFELALLAELGYALDLSACAVTGRTDDLAYVSPKSGRAVSREAASPYADRLLVLPAFLRGGVTQLGDPQALLEGLAISGHFLAKHHFHPRDRDLPASRSTLLGRLQRRAANLQ